MENNCVENKIWQQWPNESNLQYKRFEDFLNYKSDKLNKYIAERGISKTGLTEKALKNIATDFKWRDRKKAFVNHQQQIISSATDNALYASSFSQKMKTIENDLDKMYDLILRPIREKMEKGEPAFPLGKELDGVNKYFSAVKKYRELKQDIGNTDAGEHFPSPNSLEIMRGVLIEGFISKNSSLEVASLASSIMQDDCSEQINSVENKNLMMENH